MILTVVISTERKLKRKTVIYKVLGIIGTLGTLGITGIAGR